MNMNAKDGSFTTTMEPGETSYRPRTEAEIQQRAYELFLARGATHGRDREDWLQAERELQVTHDHGNQQLPGATQRRKERGHV